MKHSRAPGEKGGQNRRGRRAGRGQRATKGKRSPFSGLSRDLRARYERISQRDRKAGEIVAPGATGRIVKASVPSGVQDGQAKYEVIEAVEFDAADEVAGPGVPSAATPAEADEEGELADDEAETAEPVSDEEADEELDDEAEESAAIDDTEDAEEEKDGEE